MWQYQAEIIIHNKLKSMKFYSAHAMTASSDSMRIHAHNTAIA